MVHFHWPLLNVQGILLPKLCYLYIHNLSKWIDKCKNKFPFQDAQALARSRSVIQECEVGESEENSENSIPPLTSISSYDLSSCFKETNNLEWSVTFEQFLASIMNESCLVDYFDHQVDVVTKLKKYGDTKLNRHESVSTTGSKSVFYAWNWSVLLIIYFLSQNSYPDIMGFLSLLCHLDYFDHQVNVVTKFKKFGDTKLNCHDSVTTTASKSVFYAWNWSILFIHLLFVTKFLP